MELGKRAHAVYKIRYHLVTAVKYRKALLTPEVEECIRETMKGINERYNIIIDELGFDGDHIHIFCGARPQYSPIVQDMSYHGLCFAIPRRLCGGEVHL